MYEPHPSLPPDGTSAQAGALEAAIAHLRGGLCPDGTYEGVSEWETTEHQWRLFAAWCSSTGLIVAAGPQKEGGSEHDLGFDDARGRWIKYTKHHHAGYVVAVEDQHILMLPAGPLQYLTRWELANELFADDVELLGIHQGDGGMAVVISQKHISGEAPTWEEVDAGFVQPLEMKPLEPPKSLGGYHSKAFLSGRLALFDVRPMNCVRTDSGLIVPFDVIPQLFTATEAKVLAQHVKDA